MATVMAPVELPTGRRSYYHNPLPGPDIHDPNWIPVLDTGALNSTLDRDTPAFPPASFSLFPNQPSPTGSPKPRAGISHNYSKSSLAPESVTSDSTTQTTQDNVGSLPKSGSRDLSQPAKTGPDGSHGRSSSAEGGLGDEKTTADRQTPGGAATGPSAEGSASSPGEGELIRPTAVFMQHESVQLDASARSSMTSTRRPAVLPPTSKYNRKPVASISASIRPSFVPSLPQTPQDSPRLGPSASVPALPSPRVPPAEPPAPDSPAKVHPTKSTASERRQRALHSHPSDLSLRASRNSSSDDAEVVAQPVPVRSKSRKSMDSRATTPRSTIYDAQVPTPAPTTPLPELPPEARRPPTRENAAQRPTRSPRETPVPASSFSIGPSEHTELASFMAEKNTIVFRRFDDVHVRLLLCLQDEISQLESELLKLEASASVGDATEKTGQKTRVMRDLRKLVSEYDQMLSTWKTMQASKASETTTKELKQWLQRPGTSSGAGLGISVQQDLLWLENSRDLSSIALNAKGTPVQQQNETSRGGTDIDPDMSRSKTADTGGNGGWKAFFNCAGKRK
ncbi:hypothetical protein ABEF95_009798 [Exophiala dermatitidis]